MKTAMRLLFVPLVLASHSFAGQSVSMANAYTSVISNTSVPSPSMSGEWRTDFYIDSFRQPAASSILINEESASTGLYVTLNPGCGGNCLSVTNALETSSSGATVNITATALPTNAMYVRIQHNLAALTDSLEVWNTAGVEVITQTWTYATVSAGVAGASIYGGNGADADVISWAFRRLCTGAGSTLPLGSQMPTTAGGCNGAGTEIFEWKFDGNLNDASGNGYTGAYTGGALYPTATYATTLYQNVIANIQTLNTPAANWAAPYTPGKWTSFRAGNQGALDFSHSLSQGDTSSAVIYFAQMLSGPSTLIWSSHTSSAVTLSGIVFGDYLFQLQACDTVQTSLCALTTLDIGAAATDSNGVVVQANSIADTLFGPMIAFGQNGWQSNDYMAKWAVDAQYDLLQCCAAPTWATPLTGTVSYVFCGTGGCSQANGTTTTSALTATQLTVPIADISKIDVSVFPTTIFVTDGTNLNTEVMLVTGCTTACPGSGAATLVVGYNGRGLYNTQAIPFYGAVNPATSHLTGARAGQFKIIGNSTKFTTDSVQPVCPAAATSSLPSPVGFPVYSSGTVTMTPGSTAMTGVGTTWSNANGVYANNSQIVFVKATEGGGTPFSFISYIASGGLVSTTSITLGAAYPASADSGTFSYVILNGLAASLNYLRPDGSTGRTYQSGLQVCIGDTQMGGVAAHDYGQLGIDGTLMTAQNYSYSAGTGVSYSPSSIYSPAFYGSSVAAMAFWLRSGYQKALTLAHFIETYYSPSPSVDGGYTGVYWVTQSGAPLGGYVNLMLDPNTALTPSSLRGFPYSAAVQLPTEGCTDDPRDDGVKRWSLALASLYDPAYSSAPTYGTWLAALGAAYTGHDVGGTLPTGACKMPDNSFSNTSTVGTPVLTGLTLTNGSTAATGTGIVSGDCSTVASGTLTVANNSVAVASNTGTGFSGASACTPSCNLRIIIQQPGGAYTTAFSFVYGSASSITLNGYWPGTACTSGSPCSYTIDSAVPTQFASSGAVNEPNLKNTYSCAYGSSTSMTIFPAWSGATGSSYNMYNNALSNNGGYTALGGYAVEPFMLGGFTQLSLSLAAVADTGHAWNTLRDNVAAFMWSPPSYDPNTYGIQYAVNCAGCDQKTPYNSGAGYVYGGGNDWAQSDLTPNGGINVARGLATEPLNSLTVAFKAGLITQAFGDHVYGAQWSNTAYAPNSAGFFTPGDNLSASNCIPVSGSLGYWKWFGFCFGVGMSHQWPAARLGGVAPPNPFPISQSCVAVYTATATCSLAITAPNGVVSTVTCAVNTVCSTTIDKRQGSVLVTKQWLNGSSAVLGTSQPFVVNPL